MSTRSFYDLHLDGLDAYDLPVGALRDLCDFLVEGAARAARLAVEGRSVARGTPPYWLAPTADLRVGAYAPGSLNLAVSAPALRDVAPDFFGSQLFPQIGPEWSAMDLLLDATADAMSGKRDSERLDSGMLDLLRRSRGLFDRGASSLTVTRRGDGAKLVLNQEAVVLFDALAEAIPPVRVDRVSGTLDALTVSARTFGLRLSAGGVLRGFTGAIDLETLRPLLGKHVVVEGQVTFRPSGDALRIDADYVAAAGAGDELWARAPQTDQRSRQQSTLGTASELGAAYGKWPGDETDEEIVESLRLLS